MSTPTLYKVTLHVFFNPEIVERLAACGITARARPSPTTPQGFVLGRGAPLTQGLRPVTHVIASRGDVTITEQRRLPSGSPGGVVEVPGPQTALELAEECGRLRLDNQRLTIEVSQLRAEVDRLITRSDSDRLISGPRTPSGMDDTSRRFSLIELD